MTRRAFVLLPALLHADGAETYSYWIAACPLPAPVCQPHDATLARWALEAWARASEGRVKFRPAKDRHSARLRFFWVTGRSGLYGEARPILVDGRSGAEIYVRPDLTELGREIAEEGARDPLFRDTIVYLTCLHEAGHALGLRHTAGFEDIMYSFHYGGDILEYFRRYRRKLKSREDIRRHSGISPDDRRQLHGLFPAR